MDFYVFRHGQTDNNQKRIWQGCQIDLDLNATGVEQAHILAQSLRAKKLQLVVSSPLVRAYHTGKIVAKICQVPFLTQSSLQEANYGVAEGLNFEEVRRNWPQIFDRWINPNAQDFNIGFENGETQQEVLDRIFLVFEALANNTQYNCVGVSIHGGTIALLLAHLGVQNPRIANGEYIHIQRSDDGQYSLV